MRTSCIIPTRNRRQLLCRALHSVYRQVGPVPEIVVVDDGSTDDTAAMLANDFPGVKVVTADGSGPGPARNAGVAAAGGDVLLFLDSDDLWLPHHCRSLAAVLARGYEVAYGTTVTSDEIDGGEFLIPEAGAGPEGDCFPELARWCFLVPSSVAVTRRAWLEVGGFWPETAGEDWSFFLRLAERYHFGFAGTHPITRRRLHPGSLCVDGGGSRIRLTIENIMRVLGHCSRTNRSDLERWRFIADWCNGRNQYWKSIQQWYRALQRENLL